MTTTAVAFPPIGTFFARFKQLKENLIDSGNYRFLLHTSLGIIDISRVVVQFEQDSTLIVGSDRKGGEKAFVFTEAQLSTFVIELVHSETEQKQIAIGFTAGWNIDVATSGQS